MVYYKTNTTEYSHMKITNNELKIHVEGGDYGLIW